MHFSFWRKERRACVYVYKTVCELSWLQYVMCVCVCVQSGRQPTRSMWRRLVPKKPTVRNRLSFKHFEIRLRDYSHGLTGVYSSIAIIAGKQIPHWKLRRFSATGGWLTPHWEDISDLSVTAMSSNVSYSFLSKYRKETNKNIFSRCCFAE